MSWSEILIMATSTGLDLMRPETVLFSPILTLAILWLTTIRSFRNSFGELDLSGSRISRLVRMHCSMFSLFLLGRFSLSLVSLHLWQRLSYPAAVQFK